MSTQTMPARPDIDRVMRVSKQLTSFMSYLTFVFFLAIIVVIFATAGVIQAITSGPGETWASMWEYSQNGMRYFPLAVGIMLTPIMLPAYVANGITRREFAIGVSVLISATGLLLGIAGAAGLLVEHGIFSLADRGQVFGEPHMFTSATQVPLVVVEWFLMVSSHMAVGWIIGAVFYRYGAWRGVFLLPVTVLPAIAVEAVLSVGWFGREIMQSLGAERGPLALVIPLALAVTALTLYVGHLQIRRLAIKP